jgi:hypothetical protein
MSTAQNSNLLKAIDRWENEGGATEVSEVHLRALAISRTGAPANSRNESVDGLLRENPQRKSGPPS